MHRVGAKPLPLPKGVVASATYGGPDDCYRYCLEYRDAFTDPAGAAVLWVMMNPSAASHLGADRTVLKCWSMTHRWGYRRMLVGNAAAYRATDQGRLGEVADPVGPDNLAAVLSMATESALIVMAYGLPRVPAARAFGPAIARALAAAGHDLHAVALTKTNVPRHPLYLANTASPFRWRPSEINSLQS